jgi:hypothetical protein
MCLHVENDCTAVSTTPKFTFTAISLHGEWLISVYSKSVCYKLMSSEYEYSISKTGSFQMNPQLSVDFLENSSDFD